MPRARVSVLIALGLLAVCGTASAEGAAPAGYDMLEARPDAPGAVLENGVLHPAGSPPAQYFNSTMQLCAARAGQSGAGVQLTAPSALTPGSADGRGEILYGRAIVAGPSAAESWTYICALRDRAVISFTHFQTTALLGPTS